MQEILKLYKKIVVFKTLVKQHTFGISEPFAFGMQHIHKIIV